MRELGVIEAVTKFLSLYEEFALRDVFPSLLNTFRKRNICGRPLIGPSYSFSSSCSAQLPAAFSPLHGRCLLLPNTQVSTRTSVYRSLSGIQDRSNCTPHPKLYVKHTESPKGWGLFTDTTIPRDSFLFLYGTLEVLTCIPFIQIYECLSNQTQTLHSVSL